MRRKKILSLPTLNDRGGDLNKEWYVEIGMRDPKVDKWERRRYSKLKEHGLNINKKTTVEERQKEAQKIIDILKDKIKKGWTIFDEEFEYYLYEDRLQYSHQATIYKKQLNDNKTFSYWIDQYVKDKIVDWSLETQTTYLSRYRRFGMWLEKENLNQVDIKAIDNKVVINFFAFLKMDRGLSKKTYSSYAELIKAFFDDLLGKEILDKNPVYNLPKNKRVVDMGAERIRKDDLEKLMAKLDKDDPQLAMACRFEYYCGLRPGYEVRLLKVGDIDFRRGHSKVRVDIENAKASRRREVTIPDAFLDYLLEQGINKHPSGSYVFSKNGTCGENKLGKNNFRLRFAKYREELGLPYENKLYSMKHTGAVTLAEEGERIINIRDHLGHTSIATTEAYLKRHGFNESKLIRSFPRI